MTRTQLADRLHRRAQIYRAREQPWRMATALHLAALLDSTARRWLDLAQVWCERGRASRADIPVLMAISCAPGRSDPVVLLFKSIVECARGDLEAAERWLRVAAAGHSADDSVTYALGSVLCARGKLVEADVLFKRDVPVMTGAGKPTFTRVLIFEAPKSGTRPRPRTISYSPLRPGGSHDVVFFAAADSVYFSRYARKVTQTVAKATSHRASVHLHVINPDAEALVLGEELCQLGGVTLSIEQVDLEDLSTDQQKTYFSCARYRLLPDVMKRFGVPVVTMDMDQLVLKDPQPLFRIAEGHDVALLRFKGSEFNILSMFSATLMVTAPTEGGHTFARALRDHVECAIADRRQLLWHLDQAAIAKTFFVSPQLAYAFIPKEMLHLDGGEPRSMRADTGIFWSITNSIPSNEAKLQSAAFRSAG